MQVQDIISVPTINVIFGKRGSGKSALAHLLLEELSKKYNLAPGILNFPKDKRNLIPENYAIYENFEFPRDSIIFIDEASFFAHARKSMSVVNTKLDNIMSKCRHMNWIIVLASHHSTKIDISLIRDADNIIFKKPSKLEADYGARKGILTNMTKKAKQKFEQLTIVSIEKQCSYVFNENTEGMYVNKLPSYWSEDLSITTVLPFN